MIPAGRLTALATLVSVPSHGNPVPADDGRYPQSDDGESPEDGEDFLVRPYTVTGGRTKPHYHLEIEAMIAAAYYEAGDLSQLSPECRAILEFCRDWRSVAEISAVLRMPLGVTRILITDMAADDLVRVQQLDHTQGRPDINLLQRVLIGMGRL